MAKIGKSQQRSAVAKRLRRRGILTSVRGIETEELLNLWETFKDAPVIKKEPIKRKKDEVTQGYANYKQLIRILDRMVASFESEIVGRFTDAWRLVPELTHFKDRIDKEKVEADKAFIPSEIEIIFMPPSDWWVDDVFRMDPLYLIDHLKAKYNKYLL